MCYNAQNQIQGFTMSEELIELKEKADVLGIEYPKNIGTVKLREKIEAANEESVSKRDVKTKDKAIAGGLPKGVPLTEAQIRIAKAKEPLKVRIANMNADNSGATTVIATVVNMYMNLSRVVPLGMTIALERCLVEQIEAYTYSGSIPEVDKNGDHTGNFVTKELPQYSVARL